MLLLRAYLLAGLVGHKLLWEWMRPRSDRRSRSNRATDVKLRAIKAAKTLVLLGIIFQTVAPEIFPISSEPYWLRVAGVIIYTFGLLVAVLGRIQLGDNWLDIEEGAVLKGQRVKADGIYRYLRHPIYVGDLMLLLGLELCLNSWLVLGLPVLAAIVMHKAIEEEGKLQRDLPGYEEYAANTKRFIPFVY